MRINRAYLFILIIICFGASELEAQNNPNRIVNRSRQQWIQYYTETKINEHWSLPVDAGFRWRNNFKQSSQYILRGAVAYTFDSGLKIAAGYAHLGYYSGSNVNVRESRPYQELGYAHDLGTIQFSHRLRIEERFMNTDFSSESAVRFRYSLMLKLLELPLSATNPDIKLEFNFGNELFMSAGEEDLPTAFTQNRLIISPTLVLSDRFKIGLTWNKQYAATDDRDIFDLTDVMWIQIKHQFDWSN